MLDVTDNPMRILVVDDYTPIRNAFASILDRAGYHVTAVDDVPAGRLAATSGRFDVVIADLDLPNGSGLEVIDAARDADRSVAAIVVTGHANRANAHESLDRGALRFLIKPLESRRLLDAVEEACRARIAAHARAPQLRAAQRDLERAETAERFSRALDTLWLAVQPVVSVAQRRIVAYETLLRCDEPGLNRPDLLLAAADDLGRLHELGRRIRATAAARAGELDGVDLLVNVHPSDLEDDDLYAAEAPLSRHARSVILEVTERAPLDHVTDLHGKIVRLRQLGYRIAIDDLGAGYGSLSSIAMVRPDIVKIDMFLVRGMDRDPVRARMVRSLGTMCSQLGVPWICEGVETREELAALIALGADLIQGYLLGRPSRAVPARDDVLRDLPRPSSATRRSQRIPLASVAETLARQASMIARGVDGPAGDELRRVLAALDDVLHAIAR